MAAPACRVHIHVNALVFFRSPAREQGDLPFLFAIESRFLK
jgi:hypothetical protein